MVRTLLLGLVLAGMAASQSANPLSDALRQRYNVARQNLLESAELMPAEQYGFRLTPQQRMFSEWIGHTVMLNHNSCSAMEGTAAAPMDHSRHGAQQDKAALISALKDSYGHCDKVFAGLEDGKLLASKGGINAALNLLANSYSHYGNMVGYLRTKGLVPPSTARAQKK
jgi:hypothetical protein